MPGFNVCTEGAFAFADESSVGGVGAGDKFGDGRELRLILFRR
jgi:hypothetical protein